MRITVDIPDSMYRKLRAKASHEGKSVKELILRGVKQELKSRRTGSGTVRVPIVRSKRPGATKLDNARIFEIVPFP